MALKLTGKVFFNFNKNDLKQSYKKFFGVEPIDIFGPIKETGLIAIVFSNENKMLNVNRFGNQFLEATVSLFSYYQINVIDYDWYEDDEYNITLLLGLPEFIDINIY